MEIFSEGYIPNFSNEPLEKTYSLVYVIKGPWNSRGFISGLKHANMQHDKTEKEWTYADKHLWKGTSGVLRHVDWWNDPVSLLPLQLAGARVLS